MTTENAFTLFRVINPTTLGKKRLPWTTGIVYLSEAIAGEINSEKTNSQCKLLFSFLPPESADASSIEHIQDQLFDLALCDHAKPPVYFFGYHPVAKKVKKVLEDGGLTDLVYIDNLGVKEEGVKPYHLYCNLAGKIKVKVIDGPLVVLN